MRFSLLGVRKKKVKKLNRKARKQHIKHNL